MRSKVASRQHKLGLNPKASLSKYQKASALTREVNPFLHQLKISKKDKQSEKSTEFLLKLNVPGNLSNSISKSALRRKKRKVKLQLGGNIEDLLTVLPEETLNPVKLETQTVKKVLNHLPNPQSSLKGARKVEQLEKQRFGLIMTDKTYQASPFEALRETIKANMEKFL